MLILAMDANFWLQSKLRGIGKTDLTLNTGLAYFVDNKPYTEFIKDYIDQEEVCCHCITVFLTEH